MLGGSLSGSVDRLKSDGTPDVRTPYSADLRGQGWGAGAVAGAEYVISKVFSVFLEGGFDWFMIQNIEKSGTINGASVSAGRLITQSGKPIPLDFSAAYIRLGIRTGTTPAP